MAQVIEKAREFTQAINPKERLSAAINKARDTITTHGNNVMGEIKRLANDYIGEEGMYTSAIKAPFKAAGQLLTLNPIKAVGDLVEGAEKTIGSMTDIVTSPLRFGIAGGKAVKEGAKKAALFPMQALKKVKDTPLAVFKTLQRGFEKMNSPIATGPQSAPAPA
jgi:hypothetical protein